MAQTDTTDGLIAPPLPGDTDELERWRHTAEARRILYGRWRADLQAHIVAKIGTTKAARWGAPDMSANPLREINEEKACLYDMPPTVLHENEEAQQRMAAIAADALLWQLAQRHQRDVLALGDSLLRIDATDEGAIYRQVFPDCVVGAADPDDPMRPLMIKEARLRTIDIAGGVMKDRWCWDVLDIRDPANPQYRIVTIETDPKVSIDVTEQVLGGNFSGAAYPYRHADGKPFLPYVLYHAQQTGRLWDPYANAALVEGTKNVGMYYTEYGHLLLQAAHPQRYTVNAIPAGLNKDGRTAEMVVDPTTVVVLEVIDPDGGQVMVGQWQPGGDPVAFLDSIQAYERRLISKAGVKAAGATRSDGSPKSGYAISLSLEEKRGVQRRVAPMFVAGDSELLTKTAILLNRRAPDDKPEGWTDLPEDGWGIHHAGIPLSSEEKKAKLEDIQARIAAGAIDPVDAYIELNPGTTRSQAERRLQDNRDARARFGL